MRENLRPAPREDAAIREHRLVRAARAPVEQRSRLVRRAVAQAIEADAEEDDFEQLFEDLDERLADREDDGDFLDRPVSELVARICKDLGVSPDWSLWEDEAWARAEAAARARPPPADIPDADPPPRPVRTAAAPMWLSG